MGVGTHHGHAEPRHLIQRLLHAGLPAVHDVGLVVVDVIPVEPVRLAAQRQDRSRASYKLAGLDRRPGRQRHNAEFPTQRHTWLLQFPRRVGVHHALCQSESRHQRQGEQRPHQAATGAFLTALRFFHASHSADNATIISVTITVASAACGIDNVRLIGWTSEP